MEKEGFFICEQMPALLGQHGLIKNLQITKGDVAPIL